MFRHKDLSNPSWNAPAGRNRLQDTFCEVLALVIFTAAVFFLAR
jgi:hypothetical protein